MMREQENTHAVCPHAGTCGNCPLLALPYTTQLQRKRDRVAQLLAPWTDAVEECVPGPQTACRNKVHFAFGRGRRGATVGFFDARTKRVVDMRDCPMHGAWFTPTHDALLALTYAGRNTVYDPATGRGLLRYAVVRVLGNEALVTVVATADRIDGLTALYKSLCRIFDRVALYTDRNTSRSPAVIAGNFVHRAGAPGVSGSLNDVSFTLTPGSFLQVNEQVASAIYARLAQTVAEIGPDLVIDAYCGIGITSVLFARHAKRVIGIELVPQAIRDAKRLAAAHHADNVELVCGDCAELLPSLRTNENTLFFVDPPRAGLDRRVVTALRRFAPHTILYLSCDPETLARDLKELCKDYRIASATPYDMFPNTEHVESVVCLKRRLDNELRERMN